jgi:hypothetical protein
VKADFINTFLTAVIHPQFSSTKQDLTMPPIPIIAPQPRRLLPQPTIIDTSTPVLPINLDDPFIVSVSFCYALPYLRAHIFSLRSAIHRPPRMLNFLASCPPSVFTIEPSAHLFVFLLSGRFVLSVDFTLTFFFFKRHRSLRHLVAPSNDKWVVPHVPPAVDGTIFARKLSLHPV